MTIGQRVKRARKHAALTQKELGDAVGVRQATISDLEKGESRSSAYLVEIAKACGVRAEWLATGTGSMELPTAEVRELRPRSYSNELDLHDIEITDENTPLMPHEVEIPFLREVEFAAGDGRTQVIENHGASMRFSLDRLAKAGVQPDKAACATLSGTSMETTIMDGSPIAINKGCTHVIDGKIYALDHGGMLRVKRLYRLPLNRIRLVSDNADEYPEETYMLGHEDAPRILGRVFWWEVFD